MRIAVNALAATRGGAVTMLGPFLLALKRLEPNWRFTVYVSDAGLKLPSDGVTTVVVPTRGWRRGWLELTALDRRARRDGAELMLNVLNSGSLAPQLPSITFQRNALYFDRRWLDRQPFRTRLEAAVRRNIALLACRASASTVVPSEAMAGYVSDWPLAASLRIHVVPHGVDTDRFRVAATRLSDDEYRIGVMGHAASHRGLLTAVWVLSQLRGEGVNAQLLLTVPRYNNPAFQQTIDEVASTANRLGVYQHIIFGGATKDPAEWYRTVDILMIPSDCESFCLPLLEGLASGLPVVTSGLPVLREIADDFALHAPTVEAITAHILDIHGETSDQRLCRAKRGRRRAERFSWDETAYKMRAIIVETLSRYYD